MRAQSEKERRQNREYLTMISLGMLLMLIAALAYGSLFVRLGLWW